MFESVGIAVIMEDSQCFIWVLNVFYVSNEWYCFACVGFVRVVLFVVITKVCEFSVCFVKNRHKFSLLDLMMTMIREIIVCFVIVANRLVFSFDHTSVCVYWSSTCKYE